MSLRAARRRPTSARWAWLFLSMVALTCACRPDPTGKPCEADEQCGPGYDCYRDLCHRICTTANDCPEGLYCHRYRCLTIDEGPTAHPRGATDRHPPAPDPTVAELRAIRRELELLRQDVARISGPRPRTPGAGEASEPVPAETSGRKTPKILLPPSSPTPRE